VLKHMVAPTLESRLYDMITQVRDVVELDAALVEITELMGFRYFALSHHVDPANAPNNAIRLHNYPERWVEAYDRRSLGMIDPVHRASHVTLLGFPWSQMSSLIRMTSEDHRILDEGRIQGLGDGFTVPAHIPGEARGTCSFVTAPGRSLPERFLLYAQLAGTFAFEAARRLWRGRGCGRHTQGPILTDRQRDCVILMAQGKTDKEIAAVLSISQTTVTTHITAACERYGVYKRQLLIVLTLYDGTITFADIKPWRYPHFLG
jgi:DNA-binding CsgD family transcriptional regulator